MELQADPINWHVVTSVLGFICTALVSLIFKAFVDKLNTMDDKINGIIKFLIAHSENGEKADLSKLIGE